MLSTELEYLCTGLKCFIEGWNALYRVGMLSIWLECILQCWNDFDSVGIPLYRVGMLYRGLKYLSTELECFRQSWNTFVQG
jgi:hypothetical protein